MCYKFGLQVENATTLLLLAEIHKIITFIFHLFGGECEESDSSWTTFIWSDVIEMQKELMAQPNSHQTDKLNKYTTPNNDVFISSESERQLLLIKKELLW